MTEMQERLVRIDGELLRTQLMAQYWLALATTGASQRFVKAKIRNEGLARDALGEWRDMTPEEKVDDCLRTANTFISNIPEIVENKIKVMKEIAREEAEAKVAAASRPR